MRKNDLLGVAEPSDPTSPEALPFRKETRLTQDQLAERTGIDQAEISRIERGASNATEDTLARIALELDAEIGLVRHGKRVAV